MKYENPDMEIVEFDWVNIMTISGDDIGDGGETDLTGIDIE